MHASNLPVTTDMGTYFSKYVSMARSTAPAVPHVDSGVQWTFHNYSDSHR